MYGLRAGEVSFTEIALIDIAQLTLREGSENGPGEAAVARAISEAAAALTTITAV